MASVEIKNVGKINFIPYDEISQLENVKERETYNELFRILFFMCKLLQVSLPDLAISDSIRSINPENGMLAQSVGYLFSTTEFPDLKNDIIMLSREYGSPEYLTAVMAHEVRHHWQKKYAKDFTSKNASDFLDSLYNEAEIDADGFAIYYLSKYTPMYIEKAAGIVCPKEKKHYPKAFFKRVEKAQELADFFKKQEEKAMVESKQNKSFFNKLRKHFKF